MKSPRGNYGNRKDKKDFKKDFRNNRRGRNFNRDKKEKEEQRPAVIYNCEICGKEIQDINSAISLPETGNPAHFDCILKRISESEKVENGEQIVYLGGGSFGIVAAGAGSQKGSYRIKKRIEFEERDKVPEWRRQLVKIKLPE